jgi:hypothetical protein
MTTRTLAEIAREIRQTWPKPFYGAIPYINAMAMINGDADAKYGAETGRDIIIYALSNMTTWRGEDARRIKAELKKMAGLK